MAQFFVPSPEYQVELLSRLIRLTEQQKVAWVQSADRSDAYTAQLGSATYILRSEDQDGVPPFELIILQHGRDRGFEVRSSAAESRGEEVQDLLIRLFRVAVTHPQDEAVRELIRELDDIEDESPF